MSEIWITINEIVQSVRSGGLPDLGIWSYAILAVLVATEGPLSTLLGAAAAAAGVADLRWVVLATVVGNVLGDCLWYTIGYLGKAEKLKCYGRCVGIQGKHIDRLENGMQVHALKLILFSKVAYGLIVPTLVAAGVARVPFRKWFPVVFVMETLWSLVLVYVGYHATWLLVDFEQGLRTVGIVAVALILTAVGVFVYRGRRQAAQVASAQLLAAEYYAAGDSLHMPWREALHSVPRGPVASADTRTLAPVISEPAALESVPVWRYTRRSVIQKHGSRHADRFARPVRLTGATGATGVRDNRPFAERHASVIHALAPVPLMGEAISVRFSEAVQVWESVAVGSGPRLEAEPVEGSG
ncbi:MAG: VTT domain-containing protein [Litorilinea sp.]